LAAAATEKRGPPTTVAGDGKWLEQLLISGLSGVIHFQAVGLSLGPDGCLYVACGTSDNRARSWDGSQATVLRSGAVFRARPDGSQLREFARGFCQPRGCLTFDPLGNPFLADVDWTVGKGGGRLIHVLEGGNYGWRHGGGAAAGGELAGTLPGMLRGDSAASTGVSFVNFANGLLISANGDRLRAFATQPDDATHRAISQFALLESDDPLFRPCQAITGPDGALYVVDWHSTGDFSSGTGGSKQGRIFRLSWSGWKDMPAVSLAPRDRWAKLAADSDEQLLAHLEASDPELRRRAGQEIAARAHKDPAQAAKFRPRLAALAADESKSISVRASAIPAAGQLLDRPLREALGELLTHKDADLVRLAAEALGNSPPAQEEELAAVAESFKGALSGTADPAKLRALALGLGKLAAAAKSVDLAEWNFEGTSVSHGPKMSRYVFDGHARSLELVKGAAKELMLGNLDVALNLPEAEPAERQRLKEFVTLTAEAMRTRELAEFLDALLLQEENWFVRLPAPLEARLLACYQNILVDPPINADAVATWLDKNPGGPAEVEVAALETVSLVGTTKEGYVEKLADRLLAKPAEAALVGRSFAAGRLDRKLLPRIKEALTRHAASDSTGDAAAVLKQLEK
ncbi:MAG TPA: hypothetical protein VFB80_08575, partial [Pirellulaceae bacterium]|nr:hypothetical protein [Pirellulaceae bacterium]